jgi:hypothetical protein
MLFHYHQHLQQGRIHYHQHYRHRLHQRQNTEERTNYYHHYFLVVVMLVAYFPTHLMLEKSLRHQLLPQNHHFSLLFLGSLCYHKLLLHHRL